MLNLHAQNLTRDTPQPDLDLASRNFFVQRQAVLATMHHKERVIAPLLAEAVGLQVQVPTGFDTDRFGTFTRDVDRPGSQLDAARRKAEAVLEMTGATIALASEGAFSPHPAFPAIACDRELVLLIDRTHNLEVAGWELSTDTNYAHQQISSVEAALAFAQKIGFPDHALVVMPTPDCRERALICKGIQEEAKLIAAVQTALSQSSAQSIHLETDMRAMYNPTRMKTIAKATQNLIQALTSHCPQCQTPGFVVTERLPGLPCQLCLAPTSLIQTEHYTCQRCQYQETRRSPTGQQFADPMYCEYCNP